jgi:hypothetical protein
VAEPAVTSGIPYSSRRGAEFSYVVDVRDAARGPRPGAITRTMGLGHVRRDLPPEAVYQWMRDAVLFSFPWSESRAERTSDQLDRGAAEVFPEGLLVTTGRQAS